MPTTDRNMSERVRDVSITDGKLSVDLADGRTIITPLTWYPRLMSATITQRNNWRIVGAGFGIHWPDVDEDLSVDGMLRGAPSAERRIDPRVPTPHNPRTPRPKNPKRGV
jgi:hypothetical protein